MIGTAESLALIMDCHPDGLIVADDTRWSSRAHLDDAVMDLIKARSEEVALSAAAMHAYVWHQPDDARRAEACARLPAGMTDDVIVGLERAHAR